MSTRPYGTLLEGPAAEIERRYARFAAQPVDWEWLPAAGEDSFRTTIAQPVAVTGPGTFFGHAQRTLHFEPTALDGWWFDRTDLPQAMPIRVAANNVWTTRRNIVLCSGSPHNYMRMVEHIIALKRGLELDNLMIRADSGDPPLFERGSMDLVEALERAGRQTLARPPAYVTVREPVTLMGPGESFLTFRPCPAGVPVLKVDCAVDFQTAIGRQRLRIQVNPETTRYGALARTNCSFWQLLYSKTIGQLFADVRHLGYTTKNIVIAGRYGYFNQPGLMHAGKSLEAVWHRTIMDLVAAIALIDTGRFVGEVESYRAGHTLDVALVRKLYEHNLLCPFELPRRPSALTPSTTVP
jgi:UDP-3-O-acyl-N-acetylglucosamine deacetylase